MTSESVPVLSTRLVRGGAPRVMRSGMTGTWYVVTSYRDLGGGRFIASTKREVHPDDAVGLEAAFQCMEDWRNGLLVAPPVEPAESVG